MYINLCKCAFKFVEAHCFVSQHTSLYACIFPASVTVHSSLNANVKIYTLSTVFLSSGWSYSYFYFGEATLPCSGCGLGGFVVEKSIEKVSVLFGYLSFKSCKSRPIISTRLSTFCARDFSSFNFCFCLFFFWSLEFQLLCGFPISFSESESDLWLKQQNSALKVGLQFDHSLNWSLMHGQGWFHLTCQCMQCVGFLFSICALVSVRYS